jgi:hypothetical protein
MSPAPINDSNHSHLIIYVLVYCVVVRNSGSTTASSSTTTPSLSTSSSGSIKKAEKWMGPLEKLIEAVVLKLKRR